MANENGNGDSGGGISPSGRFARMEGALERIEVKLDNKAELLLVQQLQTRVTIIENTALTAAAVLIATKETTAHAVTVTAEMALKATVTAQATADKRYRVLLWVAGGITSVSMAYNVLSRVFGA